MSEEIKETATGELTQGEFKIKKPKKPKKLANKNQTIAKVDLSKTTVDENEKEEVKDEVTEDKIVVDKIVEEEKEVVENKDQGEEEKVEEVKAENIIEETVEEKVIQEEVETKPTEVDATPTLNVPENLESLVKFMNETGGTVEDYVNLNKDYSKVPDDRLLRDYYKKTKPHLDQEEIDFLLEDNFSWDEEQDEERAIKKKKLAYKEEIAKAKKFLESSKNDYYKELKLSSNKNNLPENYEEAMSFLDTYKKSQERQQSLHGTFKKKTVEFFKGDFEGFNFNLGEQSFRYKLNNPSETASRQSDLKSIFKKFLNEDGSVKDYSGYHKAVYAASNADNLAKHFYEQGKADATKDIIAKSKNINDNKPRTTSSGDVYINGLRVKAISGADSSKLKIKRRT